MALSATCVVWQPAAAALYLRLDQVPVELKQLFLTGFEQTMQVRARALEAERGMVQFEKKRCICIVCLIDSRQRAAGLIPAESGEV